MKLAVFDIDGTLTVGEGLGTRCFFSAFEDVFGGDSLDRRLHGYAESTDCGIAREAARRVLGREPGDAEIETFKSLYLARLGQEIGSRRDAYRPVPGADRILPLLAARPGWRVAIATGNWRQAATLKLGSARIPAPAVAACSEEGSSRTAVLAAAVACACAALRAEPGAEPAGADAANAGFERVVYVGDQPWDLRAARECSAAFLGVGSDERGWRLQQEGARVIPGFLDTEAVLSVLDELASRP